MSAADMINIFGIGTSLNVAMDFQQKMLRFGRIVNMTQNACFMPGYALTGTDKTVNLIISLSGETRDIIESLRLLKKKEALLCGHHCQAGQHCRPNVPGGPLRRD